MKIQKLTESLQRVAYMLDRKGKLHTGVKDSHLGYIHPRILVPGDEDVGELARILIDSIDDFIWYYTNTSSEDIKNKIRELMLFVWNDESTIIENNFPDDSYFDVEDIEYERFISDYTDVAMGISQEFLPCRYGGEYFDDGEHGAIYFRVTSTNFNWFNIIWEFVYNNKNTINTITIERDEARTGSHEIYHHGRFKFDHLPIEEFIMLQGNPVVESLSSNINGNFIYKNSIFNKLSEGYLPHEIIKGNPVAKIKLFKQVQSMENMEI